MVSLWCWLIHFRSLESRSFFQALRILQELQEVDVEKPMIDSVLSDLNLNTCYAPEIEGLNL